MASLGYSWVRTATGFYLQAKPTAAPAQPLTVSADWSSAAYWLALAALGPTDLRLLGLPPLSAHPDRVLLELFQAAGLGVRWSADVLYLAHNGTSLYLPNDLDCSAFPDQAQTLAVYALAVGQEIRLRGLHTLRGKETDRLLALATEINRLAPNTAHADTLQASLFLRPAHFTPLQPVHTWNDHRMALAFSLLSRKKAGLHILAPEIVNKSYPAYWKHLRQLGFSLRFAV
jgi:3-phosphoshikimate 1-carboxyvinyltransferase